MAQTLETIIAINATIGSGFGQVGSTLSQLAAQLSGLTGGIIDFGKESLETYKNYEKSMAEAEAALATQYGKSTTQLTKVMDGLDKSAQTWAASTIFHTDDVANAINEAAHAGWDYENILSGIPVAMELAQAGSMDLSTALDYLVKSSKAFDVPFDQLGNFVDMWTYAANSSAGNVQEFGDAMLKMGSTMRFTDSQAELFSLIGLMHDMGTTGTEAATLLRTSLMNILAPSGVASKTMEMLGATDEEINAVRTDAGKLAALDTLEKAGFSAFDAEGQAKPILDIYSELGDVLADIAGGYDKIDKNQTTLGILGTLFGKRGITGALNIINALDNAVELRDKLVGGKAGGYGAYAASVQMNTLYGSMETYQSKVEELKRKTGEALADHVEDVQSFAGGILDAVNGLDDDIFSPLVNGIEAFGIATAGLGTAGGALRLIGTLVGASEASKTAAAIGLITAAIAGLIAAGAELEQLDFESKFGELSLDQEAIQEFATSLPESLENTIQKLNQYAQAMEEASKAYETAAEELKSNLITDLVTGQTVEEGSEAYESLQNLGTQMIEALKRGIEEGYAASQTAIIESAANAGEDMSNPLLQGILDDLYANYDSAIEKARSLGEALANAIREGFEGDGKLDQEELLSIDGIIKEANKLQNDLDEQNAYADKKRRERKGQSQSLEDYQSEMDLLENGRDSSTDALMTYLDTNYKALEQQYKGDVESGKMTPEQSKEKLDYLSNLIDQTYYGATVDKARAMADMTSSFLSDSGLSDAWGAIQELGGEFREAGGFVTQGATNKFNEKNLSNTDLQQTQGVLSDLVERMGGIDAIQGYADYLFQNGDAGNAKTFQGLVDMYNATQGFNLVNEPSVGTTVLEGDYSGKRGTYDQLDKLVKDAYGEGSGASAKMLTDWLDTRRNEGLEPTNQDWQQQFGDELFSQLNAIAQETGSTITDMIDTALNGKPPEMEEVPENEPLEPTGVPETQPAVSDVPIEPISQPVELEPYMGDTDPLQSLQDQGVQVQVDADTTKLEAQIQASDGATLITYVAGDASELHATILDENGQEVLCVIDGDPAEVAAKIAELGDETVTVQLRYDTPPENEMPEPPTVPIRLEPYSGEENPLQSLEEQGVQVQVNGDTTELTATIDAEDGQTLLEYIDGDVSNLHAAIMTEEGQVITTPVDGDVSSLQAAIQSLNGQAIYIHVYYIEHGKPSGGGKSSSKGSSKSSGGGKAKKAHGGRVTEESIFGEAGPEWAIPERHDENTAELLDAAREASGFTWGEILNRYGGFNADAEHQSTTVVYSPTINAMDATGVESALQDDKKRLEKILESINLRNSIEVLE